MSDYEKNPNHQEMRIQELERKVAALESRFDLKGGDPWGGQPRVTDGPDSYWPKYEPKYSIDEFLTIVIDRKASDN
jgi:hypothetical protein